MRPNDANPGIMKIRYAVHWRSSNSQLAVYRGCENGLIAIALRVFVYYDLPSERAVDMREVTGGENYAENPPN